MCYCSLAQCDSSDAFFILIILWIVVIAARSPCHVHTKYHVRALALSPFVDVCRAHEYEKKLRHDSNIYSYTIQNFCRLAFKHFFSALFLFSRTFEQIKRERECVCMCSVWWMILAFGRSVLCWRCTTEIRLKEAKIYLLTTSTHTHTHKHSLAQKVRLMTESWEAERVRVVQVLHTV